MRTDKLILLLLLVAITGCAPELPNHTSSGEEVLLLQKDVSLYRKQPHVWPAKGWVAATKSNLIFMPTPYFGGLQINGQDRTYINLGEIARLQEKRWMLVFPFGLEVVTKDSSSYSLVSVRRDELIRKIESMKQE